MNITVNIRQDVLTSGGPGAVYKFIKQKSSFQTLYFVVPSADFESQAMEILHFVAKDLSAGAEYKSLESSRGTQCFRHTDLSHFGSVLLYVHSLDEEGVIT